MHGSGGGDAVESMLADLGEIAGPLTHETNDLLNSLSLHLAVIQMTASGEVTDEVFKLRKEIRRLAEIVRRFQSRRRQQLSEPPVVNINVILREVVGELRTAAELDGGITIVVLESDQEFVPRSEVQAVRLVLQSELPAVAVNRSDLRRLWRFLLGNALRSQAPGGVPVVARTWRSADGESVLFQVEDAGPAIADDALPRIFTPGNEHRQGMCCLELAACQTIVRRLHGTMHAHQASTGGLAISGAIPATKRPILE